MESPTNMQPNDLSSLLPLLNASLQKQLQGIQKILLLFPGLSPAEIEKNIRTLQTSASTSVDAFIERAKALIHNDVLESGAVDAFLKDFKKLSATDLKSFLAGISLHASGSKTALVLEVRRWLESKGTYAPASAAEKKSVQVQARLQELLGDLPERLSPMTPELADEVNRAAEAASKDKVLGSTGFAQFAEKLLGVPVKGSKPAILKQIKNTMERLVVSRAQSSSI